MRTTSLFRALGGIVGLALATGVALGAYLESDQGGPEPRRAPEPDIVRPVPSPPPPPRGEPVADLLTRVSVGSPFAYRGLTVVPLSLGRPWRTDIRTLDEATSRGWLTIREMAGAQVPYVQADNTSGRYVFLMTGEILVGGRQNRIVRDDVLLPPNSGFRDIAVYCGERHRWVDGGKPFGGGGTLAHPELRKSAAAGAPQERIWAEIEAQSDRAKVSSPTRDYQRLYEDRSVAGALDECVRYFRGRWPRATVGFVAAGHGRILGADLFGDADLCSRQWEKLLRAYAMDTLYREGRGGDLTANEARRYLDRAAEARVSERDTPGVGQGVRLSGTVEGTGLVWDNAVVHLTLFADSWIAPPPPPPPEPPIRPLPWRD
jgi:hypothetical protein